VTDLDRLLFENRRATLTTIDARDGRPRSVPICFVVVDGDLYSPLDEKPKSTADPTDLWRVRNLARDPRATILLDRWSEDWHELAWLELECAGELVQPRDSGHDSAVDALRSKYPQYAGHDLASRPLLRFRVERTVAWSGGAPS
jgi:PPOX class probable F420-dependent enzyme